MLVLIAVTALGLAAMNISNTEVNLAGNDKWQKMGFYNADPGIHGTPPVIYPNLNPDVDAPLQPAPSSPGDPGCLEYINFSADGPKEFYALMYMGKLDLDDPKCKTTDISYHKCGIDTQISVCPRGSVQLSGGGVEFASRTEGIGASGSEAKLYLMTSKGEGANNSEYTVRGHYRWVDAAGGLK